MQRYDVIVIGIGGMGSAAVYHLARRGLRVLGLEQSSIPNDLGSSHGINRIIRLAYAEDPAYVPLLRRAYELWRDLEYVVNERLLFITGGIDAGPEGGQIVKGSLESCRAHSLHHELHNPGSLRKRFPGFRLPSGFVAVYQPDGGFVLAERSIVAHVAAAQQLGAEVHGHERVLGWDADAHGVSVRSERGTYLGDRLILTVGPWAAKLAPVLKPMAVPERQVLIWTQPKRPEWFRLGAFPVFNMEDTENRYYGFPVYGIPGFKFGKYHHRRQDVDPDSMDRHCDDEDEATLRAGISEYFPDAAGPTLSMKTCLFSNSPDENFVIDHHPAHSQVLIAAGFSGHGFKFCSVVGEILADLAVDRQARWDIALFRLSRKR